MDSQSKLRRNYERLVSLLINSNMARMIFLLILFLHRRSTSIVGVSPPYDDTDEDNGGHSSEFKPMGYKWKMSDLGVTPNLLAKVQALSKRMPILPSDNLSFRKVDDVLSSDELINFYLALREEMKKFEEGLEKCMRDHLINGVVTGRIKGLLSLTNKMKQEGITDYRQITDIVALRVTLQSLDDIVTFKKVYLHSCNNSVVQIRCYGVCGPADATSDPRTKNYWPWRESGYRRLHFKVAIPHLKTAGEIQVGTPYMTLWADWEHDVVYKGPKNLKKDASVTKYAKLLAKYYMLLDDLRNGMSPDCPLILRKTKAEDIPNYDHWKMLGSPRDACSFWNDLHTNMPPVEDNKTKHQMTVIH